MATSTNVAASLLEALDEKPERIALIEPPMRSAWRRSKAAEPVEITAGQVAGAIRAVAARWRRRGVAPGDRILVQTPGGLAFSVVVGASLVCGAVPVLAEPRLGSRVYAECVAVAKPRWTAVHPLLELAQLTARAPIVHRALRRRAPDLPALPDVDRLRISSTIARIFAVRAPTKVELEDVEPDDDAVIVFTGGSTASVPKGVRLSHRALSAYLAGIGHALEGLPPFERFLAETPQQVLYALRLGRTAVTVRGRGQERARNVLELIRQGSVDAYFGAPWIWVEILELLHPDGSAGLKPAHLPESMRVILLGGAPVTRPFLERLTEATSESTAIRSLYGMTEAGPLCSIDANDKLEATGGDVVGAPLPGVRLALRNQDDGGVGEIMIHANSLFSGYLQQPPRADDEPLATGDLGRLVDGKLELCGRHKDMVIRRGVNLYPAALEPQIEKIRGAGGRSIVVRAALLGAWDIRTSDERLILVVQLRQPADIHALREELPSVLGTAALPDHVLTRDTLPTVGRLGKVDRRRIREDAARQLGLRATVEGRRS